MNEKYRASVMQMKGTRTLSSNLLRSTEIELENVVTEIALRIGTVVVLNNEFKIGFEQNRGLLLNLSVLCIAVMFQGTLNWVPPSSMMSRGSSLSVVCSSNVAEISARLRPTNFIEVNRCWN